MTRRRPTLAAAVVLSAAGPLFAQVIPPAPPQPVPPQLPLVQKAGRPARPPVVQPDAAKKDDAPPPGLKREKPDGPAEFEARMTDDSTLRVVPLDPAVTVVTKYGKLTVPLADVSRIDVGFRYPEGVEAKVDAAVASLGAAAFREREDAEKALFQLAEYALPALKRAVKSPDAEVARRAEALVKRLTEKLPAEKQEMKDYDVIETADLTIRGRLETPGLKVRTKLFGETTLQVAEVRSVRTTAAAGNEFAVDAGKYARQNDMTWFDTGVDLTTDRTFEVTAAGSVDLNPMNQANQFMATPTGNAQHGTGRQIMTPNGRSYSFAPGTLVGRIGPDGNPFIVGQMYKAPRPPGTGRLYLKIAPSPWGVDSSGSYTVKVRVGG